MARTIAKTKVAMLQGKLWEVEIQPKI